MEGFCWDLAAVVVDDHSFLQRLSVRKLPRLAGRLYRHYHLGPLSGLGFLPDFSDLWLLGPLVLERVQDLLLVSVQP